ncbi:MAG: glutamate synthase-related protein [Opitutales bacterium]
MPKALRVDLHKLARFINGVLYLLPLAFFAAGYYLSFYFHFLTVGSLFLLIVNLSYRHVQTQHTVLRNFGLIGQGRYLLESLGPELRQYLYSNDREERPFNRLERSNVYQKAKDIESAASYGSLLDYDARELKLRHSFFPTPVERMRPFELTVGKERGVVEPYTLSRPFMISAMSFGAIGENAIRALARGAARAGIPMNTGEGGCPKYHLKEDADIIFQMGTAKFGVRTEDGDLDEGLLKEIAEEPQVKMIEIKFSQGAKPGKGGMLPKEKISREIAELRKIPMGKDIISPPYHRECTDLPSTVVFIQHIQDLVPVPVGIKLCVGSLDDIRALVAEMKQQDTFPDWITVDGGEGGTGASPAAFIDSVGLPLFPALYGLVQILEEAGVRDRLNVFASGKLIDAGRQAIAFALGADACYSARGFMLALGCIQARECGQNTCPVGITTQDPKLQSGLIVENKARRVENYVNNTMKELDQLTTAMGKACPRELTVDDLYIPSGSNLWRMVCEEPFLKERFRPSPAPSDRASRPSPSTHEN